MVDFWGIALTGLFTGLGVGLANYLTDRWLKHKYDKLFDTLDKAKQMTKEQFEKEILKTPNIEQKLKEEIKNEEGIVETKN